MLVLLKLKTWKVKITVLRKRVVMGNVTNKVVTESVSVLKRPVKRI